MAPTTFPLHPYSMVNPNPIQRWFRRFVLAVIREHPKSKRNLNSWVCFDQDFSFSIFFVRIAERGKQIHWGSKKSTNKTWIRVINKRDGRQQEFPRLDKKCEVQFYIWGGPNKYNKSTCISSLPFADRVHYPPIHQSMKLRHCWWIFRQWKVRGRAVYRAAGTFLWSYLENHRLT